MKEISNISKSFMCECGTTNRFEFETDFDVHDVKMSVRCQSCGRERNINLMNFFMKQPALSLPYNQNIPGNGFNGIGARQDLAATNAPSFEDMISGYDQQLNQESNSNSYSNIGVADNSDNGFQQTVSMNENAMSMFEQENVLQYETNQQSQQNNQAQTTQEILKPQSPYAGLLDLEQRHLDSESLLEENDGIYEPFKEQNGNVMSEQQTKAIQTDALNPISHSSSSNTEKTKEEDDEVFSALFGNM